MKARIRRAGWAASVVLVAAGILSLVYHFAVVVRQPVMCFIVCDFGFPYVLYGALVMTLVGGMIGVLLLFLRDGNVHGQPNPPISPGTEPHK